MKFGKNIERESRSSKGLHYVNFKILKKKIRSIISEAQKGNFSAAAELNNQFYGFLEAEISLVNTAYRRELDELFNLHSEVLGAFARTSIEACPGAFSNITFDELLNRLQNAGFPDDLYFMCTNLGKVSSQCRQLRRYVIWNSVAVVKILKKKKKYTAVYNFPSLTAATVLAKQPWYCSPQMTKLLSQVDTLIEDVMQRLTQEPPSLERYTCPICLELIVDPVTLRGCCHRFCWNCLAKTALSAQEAGQELERCPTCRTGFLLDPESFEIDGVLNQFLRRYFPEDTKSREDDDAIRTSLLSYNHMKESSDLKLPMSLIEAEMQSKCHADKLLKGEFYNPPPSLSGSFYYGSTPSESTATGEDISTPVSKGYSGSTATFSSNGSTHKNMGGSTSSLEGEPIVDTSFLRLYTAEEMKNAEALEDLGNVPGSDHFDENLYTSLRELIEKVISSISHEDITEKASLNAQVPPPPSYKQTPLNSPPYLSNELPPPHLENYKITPSALGYDSALPFIQNASPDQDCAYDLHLSRVSVASIPPPPREPLAEHQITLLGRNLHGFYVPSVRSSVEGPDEEDLHSSSNDIIHSPQGSVMEASNHYGAGVACVDKLYRSDVSSKSYSTVSKEFPIRSYWGSSPDEGFVHTLRGDREATGSLGDLKYENFGKMGLTAAAYASKMIDTQANTRMAGYPREFLAGGVIPPPPGFSEVSVAQTGVERASCDDLSKYPGSEFPTNHDVHTHSKPNNYNGSSNRGSKEKLVYTVFNNLPQREQPGLLPTPKDPPSPLTLITALANQNARKRKGRNSRSYAAQKAAVIN